LEDAEKILKEHIGDSNPIQWDKLNGETDIRSDPVVYTAGHSFANQ
jgi:hypothetical protein